MTLQKKSSNCSKKKCYIPSTRCCVVKKLKELEQIIEWKLDRKIELEEEISGKLDGFASQLDDIRDKLSTKISQEDRIIELLEIIAGLTPPSQCGPGSCAVSGTASGNVPPDTGILTAQVCVNCVLQSSFIDYEALNPAEKSVRRIQSTSIPQPPTCTLDAGGNGTVTISGTANIRKGVGGPTTTGTFSLSLTVVTFVVTQYTIVADGISDTVSVTSGTINVSPCL